MSTLNDIMLVVDLLSSQSPVTIETISRLCNVSRKTAHQYIEVLMKANVPVYSDADRGFRLAGKDNAAVGCMQLDEAIVVLLALKQISRIVNEAYRTVIQGLNRKILADQPLTSDVVSVILSGAACTAVSPGDMSDFLTSHIINAAIALKRQLQLTLKNNGQKGSTIAIVQPRLEYSRGWHVVENSLETTEGINLKDILRAAIT